MKPHQRDAEKTKMAILDAARRLFAEKGLPGASIRDIAAVAGISHGLVQQYFGTREQMVDEIIKHEIDRVMSASTPLMNGTGETNPEDIRREFRVSMERFRDFAVLITRAELAGVEPEKMLDPNATNPAMHLASAIAGMQAQSSPSGCPHLDPALVSAYINAALFGFATLAPWLMTSVGLKPEEYEQKMDEIADISMALIGMAGGGKSPNGEE